MKKFISLFIAFVMMLSVTIIVSAESTVEAIVYRHESEEGTYTFVVLQGSVNNEKLAELISSGEIPQDTNFLFAPLHASQVTDITPLLGLTNLNVLCLNFAQFDLEPLSEFPNLKSLTLSGLKYNNSNIETLKDLTYLDQLNLTSTQISDFTFLSEFKNLRHLNLTDNPLIDITFLSGLTKLEDLRLSNTQISDIVHLTGLTNLKELNLRGTSLTREQIGELAVALPNCEIRSNFGMINPTIFDALEILKYLVNLESDVIRESGSVLSIDGSKEINPAYLITPESKTNGEPTIFDALEILKSLVGIPNLLG